jgi:hypothetical protein
MAQTTIPLEFETYLQDKISAGQPTDLNEVIFAYLPNADIDTPIDRNLGLPDEIYWVHQKTVDQIGKTGENAVVYSAILSAQQETFTFNAIYLHDKNVANSCGLAIIKEDEKKELGTASNKTLIQQYSGAALMGNITIDASTWQIDYSARVNGIDEDHRLECLDSYGHTAFLDGLDVIQQTDLNQYSISAGLVYVGGLRGTLDAENIQTITTKPNNIYITLCREGTALSKWENILTITQSETEISDYTDSNGVNYYVAKLATINADGSISDHRIEQTGELERADNFASNQDIDDESTAKKHINLEQFWRGINKKIDELTLQLEKERVSIGEIIEITGISTNPATLKGYGTWQSFGAGLVTVGVGSHTDDRGEVKAWSDEQTEGEFRHVQSESELAVHGHTNNISVTISDAGEHEHDLDHETSGNGAGGYIAGSEGNFSDNTTPTSTEPDHTHNATVNGGVENSGSSTPMNNIQPSIAVYRWKRVA